MEERACAIAQDDTFALSQPRGDPVVETSHGNHICKSHSKPGVTECDFLVEMSCGNHIGKSRQNLIGPRCDYLVEVAY